MSKLYRIGLDIGIGSVGWAILENDPVTEEPIRILKLGVRTFSPNEIAKTGESTAKARREKRGLHRRTRRRAFRLERLKNLLSKTFNLNLDEELKLLSKSDVYELRSRALDEKLSTAELSKVILNIAKRRGFKSNRKSLSSKDEGVLLSAIETNKKLLLEKGYRTVGEALYKDELFKIENCGRKIYNIRNHNGDYKNCFGRDDLINEMNLVLKSQKQFGNSQISDEFIEKVVEIFSKQRNFDEGPGKPSPYSAKYEIGKCTFLGEKGEIRAAKASFTFEYFSALSKINSLKINDRELSFDEKKILYDYVLNHKELKFETVRKILKIDDSETFNLCRYSVKKSKKEQEEVSEKDIIASSESATMVSMKNSYEIKTKLGLGLSIDNKEIINEVALALTLCKSDVTIDSYIEENDILRSLSNEQKETIKTMSFDKVGSLSIKAMEMIIPYLEQGQRYDLACKSAGFNHSSFDREKHKYLKGEFLSEKLQDITSNVVKRSVNQTIRIINEIIKEYGSPQFITIELARELSKDFSERNKIKKLQEKNFVDNEIAKQKLAEDFKLPKVGYHDLIALKLYYEQDGKCIYSGKPIDINRLFEPNYVQVDHILPYSRSMNDSYNNKVLVLTSENQNKRNQTPYEWFGSDEKRWNDFVARVNLLKNREKKRFLLKENFGKEQSNEFIERNLNDTKYMSRLMLEIMKDYLEMTPSKKSKKQVRSVNGSITSYLRKFWGLNKIREDGDTHHAIDAAVIATVSDGQIQKITKYNQLKERFNRNEKEFKLIDKETGEVINVDDKEQFEKVGIDIMSKYLPTPYPEFIEELKIRTRVDYNNPFKFTENEQIALIKLGYDDEDVQNLKPIFVSRMKTVKTTGAIHAETLMSAREYDETKMLIKSVKPSSLKLKQVCETFKLKDDPYPEYSIENYYKPESDRLLYLKLKTLLKENGSISETTQIYKPKKDGSDGPLIKTVKVYEKASNCVITPNGAAANDKMFRVDVFEKDKKFYLCPIYMADVYAKKLPNKVIERGKEWSEIDDTYNFKFSLYQNDLIKVSSSKDLILKKNFNNIKSKLSNETSSKEWLVYYNSLNISNGAIDIKTYDMAYITTIGVKTLQNVEKYYVDIMGNVYKAPKEERKGF